MLTWQYLDILSYGAGTPSTTLALMSCENVYCGQPYPHPEVPVYDAVIFCDLHGKPSWVYAQAEFTAAICQKVGIPFYCLNAVLYGNFTRSFGRIRTACLPFWTLDGEGKKGRMPRQCTYDYKIKVIERLVRYKLLCYKPKERSLPFDVHAHNLHMGIMWEERRRARESRQTLFKTNILSLKWAGPGLTVMPTTRMFGDWKPERAAVVFARFTRIIFTTIYGNTNRIAMPVSFK